MLASVNCLISLTQAICCARNFALDNAGNNIAAKMAIMAITTSNSISVKAHNTGEALPCRNSVDLLIACLLFTYYNFGVSSFATYLPKSPS